VLAAYEEFADWAGADVGDCGSGLVAEQRRDGGDVVRAEGPGTCR